MRPYQIYLYLKKRTARYAVYESSDGEVIKYVSRDKLPKITPDVLLDISRLPAASDNIDT